ncbi:hypothetical protein [Pontibacter roseus]|uniref:hypothetical protein n=1 Tax=Pontibacter roseus TaxID=336989 RepID=UPI00037A6546|nr:hypothetical protein [Pontibacter roseus]
MILDLERGLKCLAVHHQPLTEIQLKRLLLTFDEVYFTPPSDNIHFLEKGAICYSYHPDNLGVAIYSLNGFEMLQQYADVTTPTIPEDSLLTANILSYGGRDKSQTGAYQAIVMSDILPLFNNKINESEEEKLIDRFEYALKKEFIKVLDYKATDFYKRNSIALKIAYDNDAVDKRSAFLLAPLLVKKKREQIKMFIPSPPFVEMYDTKLFPGVKYNSIFPENNNKLYDYDRQLFSIVAKVNKKLALAGDFNLIPVFINQHIYNFFNYKVEKSRNNKEEGVIREWQNTSNIPLFNLSQILIKASDIHIPDYVLKRLTIPEIVSYRERCLDELYKLRKNLVDDLNEIIMTQHGMYFDREMGKFLYSKLIPDFQKYQNAQNSILQNKVAKWGINFSVGAVSSYIGTIQGLSPTLIALLGGTSPLFSEALIQLSDKLRDSKKKQYENTFAYFLNLNNR